MEKAYKTKAIILRKREWGEDELLFSFFTENFGAVDLLATGVRKIHSKLAGQLATPGILEIIFVKGKVIDKLTHAYLFSQWKIDDENIYYYQALAEIINKTVAKESASQSIWRLLSNASEKIVSAKDNNERKMLLNIFIINLLIILGYRISTDNCQKCGVPLRGDYFFDFTENGFLCPKCRQKGLMLMPANYELIKKIQENSLNSDLQISQKSNDELSIFLKDYLEYYFEKKFRVLNYIITSN